jgi:hypothetical protein
MGLEFGRGGTGITQAHAIVDAGSRHTQITEALWNAKDFSGFSEWFFPLSGFSG